MANFFIIRNKEKNMYYWGDGSWTKSKDCAKKYQHKDCAEILMQIDRLDYKICEVIEIPSISDLESKLAKKDIEIERLKQNYDEVWEDTYFSVREDFELNNNCNECRRCYAEEFSKQLAEKEKEIAVLEEQDEVYHNQLAIAELEKVRSKIARLDVSPDESNRLIPALDNYTNGFHKSRFKIVNILDQQIKSLKGEK